MVRLSFVATAVLCTITAGTGWTQDVSVPGSNVKFAPTVKADISGKQQTLTLTGVALRKKLFFNVYAMASYLDPKANVNSAEQLAAADVPKQLHLVLERNVSGEQIASGVKDSILANYSESEFPAEMKAFMTFLKADPVKTGDRVFITHMPGVGVNFEIVGKKAIQFQNVKFSKAIWDIYLGRQNLGVAIKKGLVSRIK